MPATRYEMGESRHREIGYNSTTSVRRLGNRIRPKPERDHARVLIAVWTLTDRCTSPYVRKPHLADLAASQSPVSAWNGPI